MSALYDWLIWFIDKVFFMPTEGSLYARVLFGAYFGTPSLILLNYLHEVAPFYAFWLDESLFPSWFQLGVGFYFVCLIINIVWRLFYRVLRFIPLLGMG